MARFDEQYETVTTVRESESMVSHPSPLEVMMEPEGDLLRITPDIACLRMVMVNAYFVGSREDRWSWVLVDTGIGGNAAGWIKDAAESYFGPRARPECIILTHGHFDHVGGVVELARKWNLLVYAHELELPYLKGASDYPPPDPTVGGGLMARIAGFYPYNPVDLGNRVRPLPADGSVPGLEGWQWVHTPGHTPGHISLFRQLDGVLIAGDAFVTTNQQSALSVFSGRQKVCGPPTYYTQDWTAARSSVRKLAALRPSIAATGHGIPMHGERLDRELQDLARDFDRKAVPRHGRYVDSPAVADKQGVIWLPPRRLHVLPGLLGAAAVTGGLLAGRKLVQQFRRSRRQA